MNQSIISNNGKALFVAFQQMSPPNILCFACSCAERLAPLASYFWIEEYITRNRTSIDLCWQYCLNALQGDSAHIIDTKSFMGHGFDMSMINQIYHELQHVPDKKMAINALLGDPFATSYYMSEYVRSSDTKHVVACAQRTYNAADWLACELVGYSQDRSVGDEQVRMSTVMQMEIDKLDRDLHLLQIEPLTLHIVRGIRQDSVRIGQEFIEYVDEHLRSSSTG